jgi:drug/metabolite transporter (DMT)-like permease
MTLDAARAQRRALLTGLLVVFLWSAAFTIQKTVYAAFSPEGYLFGRSILMSLCAIGLLKWRGSTIWPRMDRREWRTMAITISMGAVGHIVLVTYGLHWSTPFSASLIMACGPVCTLLLLWLMRGHSLSRKQLLGVALAFAGVLALMGEKWATADIQASTGDLVMLLAVLSFSLYTIVGTPLVARHGGAEIMSWSTLLAAPLMLALGSGSLSGTDPTQISAAAWVALVWTVLVSGFTCWILWSWVNAVRGVARTAPLMYGVPPVAGVIAAMVTGESFGGMKLAGATIALVGVALSQSASPTPRDARHKVFDPQP